jgi:dienelactone hydrolase
MHRVRTLGLILISLSCLLVLAQCTSSQQTQPAGGGGAVVASSGGTVINFSSLDNRYEVHGTLYMPTTGPAPCPAVVVVHGTTGIDERGAFCRPPILNAGIAFFEVDFKTGVFTSPMNRPSPQTFVPMGFAALKELRKIPGIDPDRIGIMGFSLGGHLAVCTAFESNRKTWMGDEKGFTTHAAFYPVCRTFLKQSDCRMTGAPMIIFYGTEDCYGEGKNVPRFKQLLKEKYNFDLATVEYPGVQHGFNRDAPPMHYVDPAANGTQGYIEWNADAANDSLTKVVDFLRRTLSAK